MKIFLALFLFFSHIYFSSARAYEYQFIVTDIVSDESIQIVRLDKNITIAPGDILAIYSHQSQAVIGYARIHSITDNVDKFLATIQTHHKSALIQPDNYLKKLDLSNTDNNIPARFDLTYRDESKVAAKYRPLVYAGLVQGMTAANLTKKEIIIGPSVFAYGITSATQANINLASVIFGVVNIGVKNSIFKSQDFDISVENGVQYYSSAKLASYQFTGYLDMTSNSHFKSFAKLKVFTQKPEDESLSNNAEYQRDVNLEFQIYYGYIFPDWNQIIFGPKVDVNQKKVGGAIGYYIVEKDFNTMFGISSNDFSEFRLGKQAYLLNLDFWWRF